MTLEQLDNLLDEYYMLLANSKHGDRNKIVKKLYEKYFKTKD